jgi:hypothetical protein
MVYFLGSHSAIVFSFAVMKTAALLQGRGRRCPEEAKVSRLGFMGMGSTSTCFFSHVPNTVILPTSGEQGSY